MPQAFQFDAIIIGTGAAGLTAALHLPKDWNIALVSKGKLNHGSTSWAQGGVAAVLDRLDSVEKHVQDTLGAGAGLCNEAAVRFTIEHSETAIKWLIDQGVPFTENPAYETKSSEEFPFHLTREGGHSHRRIIHAADATGKAISDTLVKRVLECDNIRVFEDHTVVDLITRRKLKLRSNRCVGAYILDRNSGSVDTFRAPQVILATGGAAKAYLYTSNPDGTSGDGIAMAWRAGCRVANMEFNQFHPTCLYHPHAKSYLITEAVRGEGGKLLLPNGDPFMHRFDDRKELAPRDIVARAIDHEMKRLGVDNVFLDISHKDEQFIKDHFPTIHRRCLKFGIDITSDPIPVVPAAHYTCGGIKTDLCGRTDVPGLYAIGECAYTGLHGANRLASNSLLECFVFARSAVEHILGNSNALELPDIPDWDETQVTDSDEDVVISHNWDEVRRFMWDYVGIVRTTKRLTRAKHRVQVLQREIAEFYSNYKISNDLLELRNLVMVAELIIDSALNRKESRGLHFTKDFPDSVPAPAETILTP